MRNLHRLQQIPKGGLDVLEIISLILLGFLMDLVISLHYRFIAEKRAIPASISSSIYLVASFLVYKHIISDSGSTLVGSISYAIGAGGGCYLAVAYNRKHRKEQKNHEAE